VNKDAADEVPEGAAVFPLIPPEAGVNPLLLAVLHATVFAAGSDEAVVQSEAAGEALEYVATYLQRLEGADLERVRADLNRLLEYARREKWQKSELDFLTNFLTDYGIGAERST
jgi:hypothetical protein